MEYWIHSLGGQATAKINRDEALSNYYANPSICEQCHKVIPVLADDIVADIRKKRFCNKSCAARFSRNKAKEGI
jgi:hypothetical protein